MEKGSGRRVVIIKRGAAQHVLQKDASIIFNRTDQEHSRPTDLYQPNEKKRFPFESCSTFNLDLQDSSTQSSQLIAPESLPTVSKVCKICNVNYVDAWWFQSTVQCNRSVQAVMPCGHEVTWQCGYDADPRGAIPSPQCLGCVSVQWRHYIDTIVPVHLRSASQRVVEEVRNAVISKLETLVGQEGIVEGQNVTLNLEAHILMRCCKT